jgi:predicted TIM-barrel fold metal-dependent hydrolase
MSWEMDGTSRRDFCRALAGLGAAASLANARRLAQAPAPGTGRIDLHHHFYVETPATKKFITNSPDPQPMIAGTPVRSIEAMEQAGVATAYLSCPLTFGDHPPSLRDDFRQAARDLNEHGARLVADYKGRFGLFAMLPLPDVDSSLREIEYAFGPLKADGVAVMTSYGNQWLGDVPFEPIFDELNRRQALVLAHPVAGPCCRNLQADTTPQTIEYGTDTSRAIWSLINDGTPAAPFTSRATRYANVRFVWSHGGGSLPGLVGRFLSRAAVIDLESTPLPDSRLHHLRRFFYDTAASANAVQMAALKSLVGVSQIVFGSDYPYVPIVNLVQALAKSGLTPEEVQRIERQNALALLRPRA